MKSRKKIMGVQLNLRRGKKTQFLLALTVGVASLAPAAFGLIYPSNYSPALFLGSVVAAIIFISWIKKPVLALYVALFMVLLPVGIMPDEIHSQLNRTLTVIVFGVWALDILINRRRIFLNGTALVMLAFLAWSLLTLIWANNFEWAKTLIQVYALRFVLFVFLMPHMIRTRKKMNGMFKVLALNGLVLLTFSGYTLFQNGYTSGSRFKLLGVNENAISLLSLIILLGVLWVTTQLSHRKRVLKIFIAVVFSIFMIVVIFASGSRGSAISLIISIIAFLLWRETRSWGLLCIFVLFLAMIFAPSLFITTVDRFLMQTSDSQSLLGGREVLWKAAWQMIREHPLGGVGIGNARLSILPYLDIANSRADVSIHNPILVIWSETGLIGILLYLGILASATATFIRQYLHYKNINIYHPFLSYFAFVSSVFLGYMASWIKGGGLEMSYSYFFMLALLLIPSNLDYDSPSIKNNKV